MAMTDNIQMLRDRTLPNLNVAYDYYTHTKIAWGIVRQSILTGNKFAVKAAPEIAVSLEPPVHSTNSTVLRTNETGTKTTEQDLLAKASEYVKVELPEATFLQFISIFEAFLGDFLRLWFLAHPESLSKKQVDFKTILESQDKDAITQVVVDRELNEVTYKSPADWFEYLDKLAKLNVPNEAEIQQFTEAKASRDVLVHNRGVANKTYVSKVGKLARYGIGERIEIPGDYHKATWELVRKMVADISTAAIQKVQ
jgi:hypothetical protein